jgi:hypothetical protein
LGGYHAAYTDNIHALFVNPAALQRANQSSGVELAISIDNLYQALEAVEAIKGIIVGNIAAIGDLAGNGKIPLGIDIRGPLSVEYTANGLGFGIWDQFHVDMNLIGTSIEATVLADLIANFGMSFNIPAENPASAFDSPSDYLHIP